MKFSAKELAEVFPDFKGASDEGLEINTVFTDSRKVSPKGLFIPIKGDNFDGHHFLKDAILSGAIASLWNKDVKVPDYTPTHFPLFFVDDTIDGLQKLAKYYLQKVSPIVIGVTGSNGKTTTKDMISSVVSRKYITHKTNGNFNNHIGLPLTILNMEANTEVIVLEMGMNHFGEISLLSKISKPDIAVISNIGESHIEYLGSREGIAKAKLEIIDGLKENGLLIIDGDERLLTDENIKVDTITCGFNNQNDLCITSMEETENGLNFSINGIEQQLSINTIGSHNVKNATYAVAVGKKLKLSNLEIKEGLLNIEWTSMRMQRFKGKNDCLLINDAYNASPTSMIAAIETLKGLKSYDQKIVVLGDMYELGPSEQMLHKSVANHIGSPITECVTIGEKGNWIGEEVRQIQHEVSVRTFDNKEDLTTYLKEKLNSNTAVLFKASRKMKLETVVMELS